MTRKQQEEKLSKLLQSGRKLMFHTTRVDGDGDTLHDAVQPGSVPIFKTQGWKLAVEAPVEIKKVVIEVGEQVIESEGPVTETPTEEPKETPKTRRKRL